MIQSFLKLIKTDRIVIVYIEIPECFVKAFEFLS